MTEYVTVAEVDTLLGAGWAGTGDPARAVLMANAWLSARPLPVFSPAPAEVVQAGAEVAREAAAGRLYADRESGLLSKSVDASGVLSSKTYAAGSRSVSAGEQLALALLAPWLGSGNQIRLVRG